MGDARHPSGQAAGQLGGCLLHLPNVGGHVGLHFKAVSQKVQHTLALVGRQRVGGKAGTDALAKLVNLAGIDHAIWRVADTGTMGFVVRQNQHSAHMNMR